MITEQPPEAKLGGRERGVFGFGGFGANISKSVNFSDFRLLFSLILRSIRSSLSFSFSILSFSFSFSFFFASLTETSLLLLLLLLLLSLLWSLSFRDDEDDEFDFLFS